MTIRITTVQEEEIVTIRVEGRLDASTVPDLLAELSAAGAEMSLELAGLCSADAAGLRALRSLEAKGVELHGASLHIRELLRRV